jgi:hypothetical protein
MPKKRFSEKQLAFALGGLRLARQSVRFAARWGWWMPPFAGGKRLCRDGRIRNPSPHVA